MYQKDKWKYQAVLELKRENRRAFCASLWGAESIRGVNVCGWRRARKQKRSYVTGGFMKKDEPESRVRDQQRTKKKKKKQHRRLQFLFFMLVFPHPFMSTVCKVVHHIYWKRHTSQSKPSDTAFNPILCRTLGNWGFDWENSER